MNIVSFAIFVVYCIALGALVAFLFTLISKAIMSKVVSALIKEGAKSVESAKTLDELSVKKTLLLEFALKKGSTVKRLIKVTDEGRYYLPEESVEKASRFYVSEKLTLPTLVMTVVLIVVLILLCEYLPTFI